MKYFFCVSNPDSYVKDPKNSNGGYPPSISHIPITGFQFVVSETDFYATQLFSLKHNYEMWDLFDFLVNNKIKFKYKYKLIDPKVITVPQ